MRIIDADALIRKLENNSPDPEGVDEWISIIEKEPTIDVAIPSTEPKTGHWKDFAVWVAKEIFDDEWEYNKDAFAEIACRKLNKLGIVKANGDKWELFEPQESEVNNG